MARVKRESELKNKKEVPHKQLDAWVKNSSSETTRKEEKNPPQENRDESKDKHGQKQEGFTDMFAKDVSETRETIRTAGERVHDSYNKARAPVKEKERVHSHDFKRGDLISLFTLIATILLALIIPVTQAPVLDYAVDGPFLDAGNTIFRITIRSIGSETAKNIVLSMSAENTNFGEPKSNPFLANHIISNETAHRGQIGKALVEIDSLPPRSHTIITVPVVSQSPTYKLETNVRADEGVAYHGSGNLMIFYVFLSASYIFFALMFGIAKIKPITSEYKIKYDRIAVIGILIISGIVTANLFLYLPHIDPDNVLYVVYYYSGMITIPLIIAILAIIYHNNDRRRYRQHQDDESKPYETPYLHYPNVAIAAGFLISGLIAANLLFILNPAKTDSRFYLVYHWIGIITIPTMILITIIIYQRWTIAILYSIGLTAIIVAIWLIAQHLGISL